MEKTKTSHNSGFELKPSSKKPKSRFSDKMISGGQVLFSAIPVLFWFGWSLRDSSIQTIILTAIASIIACAVAYLILEWRIRRKHPRATEAIKRHRAKQRQAEEASGIPRRRQSRRHRPGSFQ